MSEPTYEELSAICKAARDAVERPYPYGTPEGDQESGPWRKYWEQVERDSLLAVFRAGAASQPTAAEVAATIVARVRDNCTPSHEAYTAGGDHLIIAVAEWIENPPEWVDAPWARQANLNPPAPVQVVPETLELDPKPMTGRRGGGYKHAYTGDCTDLPCEFKPDPEFSQDRTAYGLPTEEQR
jgi:hypothetical protein